MSPVDRVHQVLVAVSSRPSPNRGDEVAVAVRVGTSTRPEAHPAETGRTGTGAGRQAPPFRTPSDFALPPPPMERAADSDAYGLDPDAHLALPVEDDDPAWVSVSATSSRPVPARRNAVLPAEAMQAQSTQGLHALRQRLAYHRGREAYGSTGVQVGASAPARLERSSGPASPGLHVIA